MKNRKISRYTSRAAFALFVVLGAPLIISGSDCVHAQDATEQVGQTQQDKPFLHPLFSDNAVLQRDRPVPIWGWTTPQSQVTVRLDNEAAQTTTADKDGRWTVSLASHAAGGPHSLAVAAADGATETRKNLLFGDVWICSGQSNMAYDLRSVNNYQAEVAAANYPEIRLMQVPTEVKAAPIQTFQGAWQVCSPQTVEKFSATGYFFGRTLYRDLKVPIGLIDSSASGTPAQAWGSAPALRTMPDYTAQVDTITASTKLGGTYANQMQMWWQTNDPGTKAGQEAANFNDADWKTISEPGTWEDKGFPNFDGVMWFRRTLDVPANWAGRDLTLNLGNVDDQDTTYWNGALVGATGEFLKERHYTIPGNQVKAGRNVIAMRVLDTGGGGGLAGPDLSMKSGDQTASLAGPWKFQQGPELKSLPATPLAVSSANDPTVLYNSKIAPLLPGAVKGILWYQGESNADRVEQAIQYRTLLPTLINDWRAKFGEQTPFYIMQLANFKTPDDQPSDKVWPNLREAQLLTARALPQTYITVISDLGDEKNVHFPNKQEAGRRLALTALEHSYSKPIESSGPTLKNVKTVGDTMQLSFDHAQGLNLKGDGNRVFALAGTDLKFYWATPQVAGNVVTLRSPDVLNPLYARSAWADNPRANLTNTAGLPASPFRTDGDARFPVALAQNKADATFAAWNNAFLVRDGDDAYYSSILKTIGHKSEGSWVLALDIEIAEDAYERTRSKLHRQLVGDLLTTFLAQNSYDWAGNTWNDDMAWMCMALVRGYQITGNPAFLDKGAYAWNLAYDRGWDTKYGGGGVWENMDNFVHGDGNADKLALSNTTFVPSGVALYQITGDVAYLNKSKAMYSWVRENAFDKKTGQVNEGVKWPIGKPDEGRLEDSDNVYNSGSFVQAANQLHRVTGDKMYYDDAVLAISHVVKTPILANDGGPQTQWQYRFIKGLSQFATDNNGWPQYEPWMRSNAEAAWKNRNDLGLTGNNWLKVKKDPTINAMETSSAVGIWQMLPPANNEVLAGNYTLRNAASKLLVSVGGVAMAEGSPIVQTDVGLGATWNLVPTSGGYYRIQNATSKSGLVMAIADDSAQPFAKLVQQRAQGMNPGSDQWFAAKNADGTYSFYNLNSQMALDLPAANVAPNTQFGQYFGNDSAAQRFVLTPR